MWPLGTTKLSVALGAECTHRDPQTGTRLASPALWSVSVSPPATKTTAATTWQAALSALSQPLSLFQNVFLLYLFFQFKEFRSSHTALVVAMSAIFAFNDDLPKVP